MGESSKIEWTHHTYNPVWGCTKVSAGCAHCYAETLAKRYGKDVWGPGDRRTFGDKHWNEPLKWARDAAKAGERRRVFCGSMCDVFEDHPTTDAQLPRLMALVRATSYALDWLLLTKRPERAAPYLRGYMRGMLAEDPSARPAWWLGTSVEDQPTLTRAWEILKAPAAVRFLSCEPLLGPVDLDELELLCKTWRRGATIGTYLDWVIVGGESGPGARPFDIEWARSVVRQCREAGVACFVKQLGAFPVAEHEAGTAKGGGARPIKLRDRKGGDWTEWPEDLRVREFPA